MLATGWPRKTRGVDSQTPNKNDIQTTSPSPPAHAQKRNPRLRLQIRSPSKVYEIPLIPIKAQPVQDDRRQGKSPEEAPPPPTGSATQLTQSSTPTNQDHGHRQRFLFRDPGTHISHRFRSSFIARVASTQRWRPRLAYKLIPKYIQVLDGPCTAFLLRHLASLQPAEHEALLRQTATDSLPAAIQHTLQYLHNPTNTHPSTPTAFKPPWMWRQTSIRVAGGRRKQAARRQSVVSPVLAERQEFNRVILSICLHAAPKLHLFSGGVLSDIASALGDLHVRPPPQFWRAWEAATIPLLEDMSAADVPATEHDPSHPRLGLRACHVGNMMLGMARCRHAPSKAWQDSMWLAVGAVISQKQLRDVDLALLCEGWALACLHCNGKPGGQQWQLPAVLLQAVTSTLQQQLEQQQTTSDRFNVAPLLAVASHLHAMRSGQQHPVPYVVGFARCFVSWWAQFTLPLFKRGSVTRRAAAAALWGVTEVMMYKHKSTAVRSNGKGLTPSHRLWLDVALELLINSTHLQTATYVHLGLICVQGLQHIPPPRLRRASLDAVQDVLPIMTPSQVLDVLPVLHDWHVPFPMTWPASLSLYVRCRGCDFTHEQRRTLDTLISVEELNALTDDVPGQ